MSDDIYEQIKHEKQGAHIAKSTAWYEKFLTPKFRKWAYGLSAAAIAVGATLAGKPEFIPVIAPLLMALFFVNENGDAQ